MCRGERPPGGQTLGGGSRRNEEIIGIGLAAGAAVAFGTLAISAKYAYAAGATVVPLLALRFLIAAVLLVAFHLLRGTSIRVPRRVAIRLLLLGGIGYAFEASLFFAALTYSSAAVVGLVFYSYPVWTSLIALLIGLERASLPLFAALALGSAGVLTIFSLPEGGLIGPLLALASAVAVAVYLIAAQFVIRDVPPSAGAAWTAIGATISLSLASAVTTQGLPAGALGPAALLGLATALAFLAMYAAIARIGSSRTAIANMLEPVTTLLLAAIVLHEALSLRVIVGTALVVAALPVLAGTKKAQVPAADSA